MHRFLSWTLATVLLTGLVSASLSAVGKITGSRVAAAPAIADEVALLPQSDLIAVVDVSRFFSEVVPKIKTDAPADIAKMTKEMEEFASQTGIDPTKIKTAILGAKLQGESSTAIILQGLSFDAKLIETTVKSKNGEFKTTDYKGRQIITVKMKAMAQAVSAAASAGVSLNTGDDINFAALDGQTAVAGDLAGVKSVLDAQAGSSAVNSGLSAALKDTKATGLVRFAANLPESVRKDLDGQGDIFKQLSAIKLISGSLDLTSDLSPSLDALLRTGSADEASQLETGLKSLIFLGKSFLGGNQDPQMQSINQLLDQVKISTRTTDVSFSLAVPRALLDKLTAPEKKTESTDKTSVIKH